jgi:hypothetical protein
MEHARRVANAAGVHRHVEDLSFDPGGVTGVRVLQQKSAPFACVFLAAIALFPLARRAMSDNIGPLAVRAMQDLQDHDVTRCRVKGAQTLVHPKSIADQHL